MIMKKAILIFGFCFPLYVGAQNFSFSPSNVLETWIDGENYSSDYIYINNNSGGDLVLKFKVIENSCVLLGWDNTVLKLTKVLRYSW